MTFRRLLLSFFLGLALITSVNADNKINLNTATQQQLESIGGIGPKTAKAIIVYREKNGDYQSLNDLVKVKGIGDKKLAKISAQLTITDPK